MIVLSPESVRQHVDGKYLSCLESLEQFSVIGSTNSYLLAEPCPAPGHCRVVLAGHQTNGRGRRNRTWISPPSTGLYMSLAFTFKSVPQAMPSLSLAVGIGIAQTLQRLGICGIGLKWPNDVVARDGKVGGILSEVHASRDAGVTVVTGVGLNVDFGYGHELPGIETRIGRAVDLASCCDNLPERPALAGRLISSLIDTLQRFQDSGFSAFHTYWQRFDWLRGKSVTIESQSAKHAGVAQGVDTDGALLLNAGGDTQRITSGSVLLADQPVAQP